MPVTTTTAANLIQTALAPGYVDALWRNNAFLQNFPAPVLSPGDTSRRWNVNYSGNSSVGVFTEGLPAPAPGQQDWTRAAVAYTYFWFWIQASGHARDALRSNFGVDAIAEEAVLGRKDMLDLINTSFMGSTYGIEVAIDSGTTYAGITRGANDYWESTETSLGGAAVAATDLLDLQEAIRDNDKGGRPSRIFLPLNQETRVYQLAGVPGTQMISDADKAPSLYAQRFAGMPIVAIPDFTDTVIVMADMSEGEWEFLEHRPFRTDFAGRSGDSDVYECSWAGALVCKNPKNHGKLTTCAS